MLSSRAACNTAPPVRSYFLHICPNAMYCAGTGSCSNYATASYLTNVMLKGFTMHWHVVSYKCSTPVPACLVASGLVCRTYNKAFSPETSSSSWMQSTMPVTQVNHREDPVATSHQMMTTAGFGMNCTWLAECHAPVERYHRQKLRGPALLPQLQPDAAT